MNDNTICLIGKGRINGIRTSVQDRVYDANGVSPALTVGFHPSYMCDGRIRKMTPKEYFRLMGFDDSDVDLLSENGISNTQLYKMAGNSIVVNVLGFLFCQIFDSDNEIWV